MSIYENLQNFNGKPVQDFVKAGDISDFGAAAPRVRCEYDENYKIEELLSLMLEQTGAETLDSLVIGIWMDGGEAVDVTPNNWIEFLVAEKSQLPNLSALFAGDIISEENEISWINQGDYSSIWAAFPKLHTFYARGGNGLRLGKINHNALEKLVIQTGGMPAPLVREALEANAPLKHLELWLGDENYGANTSVDDFQELLDGKLFPDLKYLGLCNSQYSDDLAEAVVDSAIIDRIETLDLSKGTLTDRGADALISSGKLANLKLLNVEHHYLSENKMTELKAATPNIKIDQPEEADEWGGEKHYYVAVSE